MTKRGHVHSVMLMLLLLLLPGLIDAQCYLMNANSDCEVCWRTVYNDDADKTGVTTMAECPASIVETWDTPLPPKMEALQKYGVVYSLHLLHVSSGPLVEALNRCNALDAGNKGCHNGSKSTRRGATRTEHVWAQEGVGGAQTARDSVVLAGCLLLQTVSE